MMRRKMVRDGDLAPKMIGAKEPTEDGARLSARKGSEGGGRGASYKL